MTQEKINKLQELFPDGKDGIGDVLEKRIKNLEKETYNDRKLSYNDNRGNQVIAGKDRELLDLWQPLGFTTPLSEIFEIRELIFLDCDRGRTECECYHTPQYIEQLKPEAKKLIDLLHNLFFNEK